MPPRCSLWQATSFLVALMGAFLAAAVGCNCGLSIAPELEKKLAKKEIKEIKKSLLHLVNKEKLLLLLLLLVSCYYTPSDSSSVS